MNQLDFPFARPMLHVHLALLRQKDSRVLLGVDEALKAVFPGEPIGDALAMFLRAARKVDGGIDIKNAVSAIGHNVYPRAHWNECRPWVCAGATKDVDGRVKPGQGES
jgi:hypothetical protein